MRFSITSEMVARFASLTGDSSSLHTSEAFARRSAYRRTVVHGMLPVGFLVAFPTLRAAGQLCVPASLAGAFMAPVFVDDILDLIVEESSDAPRAAGRLVDFKILKSDSRQVVTRGTMALDYVEGGRTVPAIAGARKAMVAHHIAEQQMTLEQVEKGMKDQIPFSISGATCRELVDILALGLSEMTEVEKIVIMEEVHLPNVLAVLLLSTSVGISLPGATATFLEFSAEMERQVRPGTEYNLNGEVTHRSGSTRIIRKGQIAAHSEDSKAVVMRGKVAVLVNDAPPSMPSMAEIRTRAAEWGLSDKVVVVTGASRGIGETIAKLMAVHGARVVVNYRTGADDARRIVAEITEDGGRAKAIGADITNAGDVRSLIEQILEAFGAVHVLVNNAARDFRPIPFAALSWEEVQRDIDVVAKGAFLCCQQVIPGMLNQGGGKIINISSAAVEDPPPDQTKYVMAKSALVGLTRSLAAEYASRNIQVNMVVPSFVETDFVAHVPGGFRARIARETPMQRLASPVEVAQAVVFLASSFSSFTTGQKLMVTGGGLPYL